MGAGEKTGNMAPGFMTIKLLISSNALRLYRILSFLLAIFFDECYECFTAIPTTLAGLLL